MPGGDGTGPVGHGPMTGRAAGFCAGNQMPGYANPGGIGYGRGIGFGRGRGRGFGRGYWGCGRGFWFKGYNDTPFNQPSTKDEKVYLENLVKNLEDELKTVKDRLQDLTKEKKDS